MASNAEYLTKLEKAIDTFLENGAVTSYTYDGVTVTRENLDSLLRARSRLQAMVNDASRTSSRVTHARRGCR